MRANIDLTDNRDFDNRQVLDVNSALHIGNDVMFPWKVSSDSYILNNDDIDVNIVNMFILPLGNGDDRKITKLCKEEESADVCACCGRKMHMFPYKINLSDNLCTKCKKRLDDMFDAKDKVPWRMAEEREPNVFDSLLHIN